jgi:hypothetical protein
VLSYPPNVRSRIGGATGDGFDRHRLVWVKLSLIFLRQRDKPMPAELPHPTAVDTTVETPGILLQWLRSNGGEWLGLVSYQLPFADGRKKTVYLERQLVPAYALRPRKYGRS